MGAAGFEPATPAAKDTPGVSGRCGTLSLMQQVCEDRAPAASKEDDHETTVGRLADGPRVAGSNAERALDRADDHADSNRRYLRR